MKIKILVVPTLILASGFVMLHSVKPGFDTYMEKRALRDNAQENALQAETIAKNAQALRGEVDAQAEKVSFIKRYLPAEKDQGRMFDNLNFLVSQAGLVTSKIQTVDVEEKAVSANVFGTLDPVADADPLAVVDPSDPNAALAVPAAPSYTAPSVKKYSISIEAIGTYPSMKEALAKLSAFDRFQEVKSFRIAETPETGEEGASTLTLTYVTELPYQAAPGVLAGEAIVAIPGLNQPNFNFEAVDAIRAAATAVPDVVLGTEGKANPFVE